MLGRSSASTLSAGDAAAASESPSAVTARPGNDCVNNDSGVAAVAGDASALVAATAAVAESIGLSLRTAGVLARAPSATVEAPVPTRTGSRTMRTRPLFARSRAARDNVASAALSATATVASNAGLYAPMLLRMTLRSVAADAFAPSELKRRKERRGCGGCAVVA